MHKAASLGAASAVTALLLRKADINSQSTVHAVLAMATRISDLHPCYARLDSLL